MPNGLSKYLIIAGLLLTAAGLVVYMAGNKLNWFGNLPGDFKIDKPGFKFYFPLASMLLVSIILNLLIYFIRKFF